MDYFAFNANAVGFSARNMAALAHCAKSVYRVAEIPDALAELGFSVTAESVVFDEPSTDTHGFIVGDADKIILAFAGTQQEKIADWMTDANLLPVIFQADGQRLGWVHQGFWTALDSVWETIWERLRALRDQEQSLWITGHSLGGALATLAAAKLVFAKEGLPVAGVYTFGQPRVGNGVFAQALETAIGHRVFRVVNHQDIVPRVPPRSLGYRHLKNVHYFDAKGGFHQNPNYWNLFFNQVLPSLSLFELFQRPVEGVQDHDMGQYRALALNQVTDEKTAPSQVV